MHILPKGFVRFRYYGFWGNPQKKNCIELCKKLLNDSEYSKEEKKDISSWQDLFLSLTGIDLRICPKCKKGRLIHKRGLVKKNIILLRFG